jgi:hypothetical protein
LPPQLSNNKGENEQLNSIKNFVGGSTKFLAGLSGVSNLFLSAALNQLWGMINSLQLIVYLSKLNFYFPANLLSFYD